MSDPIGDPIPEDTWAEEPTIKPRVSKPADVKNRQNIEALERDKERELRQVSAILSTDEGEAFVMRALERCGVYRATFHSSHAMASFTDGQRDIGLWMLDQIQRLDPERYGAMLVRHVKRQRRLNSIESQITAAT